MLLLNKYKNGVKDHKNISPKRRLGALIWYRLTPLT